MVDAKVLNLVPVSLCILFYFLTTDERVFQTSCSGQNFDFESPTWNESITSNTDLTADLTS